jgi:hypothetical protein
LTLSVTASGNVSSLIMPSRTLFMAFILYFALCYGLRDFDGSHKERVWNH